MADSITRRTDDIMELVLDKRGNTTQTIRVQTSPDMTTWTTRVDIPAKQTVNSPGLGQSWRGKVFHKFILSDYALAVPLFLRFQDIDGGAPVTTSNVYLALEAPRSSHHYWMVSGSVPQGAALANSICIEIPATLKLTVANADAASPLAVAFSKNGPEKSIAVNDSFAVDGNVKQIWLRGIGGAADFEIGITTYY